MDELNSPIPPQQVHTESSVAKSLIVITVISALCGLLFYIVFPLFASALFWLLAMKEHNGVSYLGVPLGFIGIAIWIGIVAQWIIVSLLIILAFCLSLFILNRFHFRHIPKKWIFLLCLFGVLPIAFFSEIRLFGYTMLFKPSPQKMQSALSSTKDWKTYKSRDSDFTLQYPPYLEVRQSKKTQPEEHINFVLPDGSKSNFSISVYTQWEPAEALKYYVTGKSGQIIENTEVTIDGIQGKKIVSQYPGAGKTLQGAYTRETAIIISNDKTFAFSGTSYDSHNPENAVFDQFMRTIKFTKKGTNKLTASIDTSDWKTYRSPNGSYELRYPSDWNPKADNITPDNPYYLSSVEFANKKYDSFRVFIPIFETPQDYFRNSSGTCDEDGTTREKTLSSGVKVLYTDACSYSATFFLPDKSRNIYTVFQSSFKLDDDPLLTSVMQSFYFISPGPDLKMLEEKRLNFKAKQTSLQSQPETIKAQRDVEAIAQAISQFKKATGEFPKGLSESGAAIDKTFGDICSDLVPEYLPSLPVYVLYKPRDPITNCNSDYNTLFYYKKLDDGRIKIYAPSRATIEAFTT